MAELVQAPVEPKPPEPIDTMQRTHPSTGDLDHTMPSAPPLSPAPALPAHTDLDHTDPHHRDAGVDTAAAVTPGVWHRRETSVAHRFERHAGNRTE